MSTQTETEETEQAEHDTVVGTFDGLTEPRNPGGHACIGWTIEPLNDRPGRAGGYHAGYHNVWTDPAAEALGLFGVETTNNICEYLAAIECLRQVYRLPWRGPVLLTGDSKLVVEQYHERWQCKSEHLQRLLKHLRAASSHFMSVEFMWVPRDQNQAADKQARRVYRQITGKDAPQRGRSKP